MVKHKFASSLGRQRVFRDGESKSALVHYDGTQASAFLLGMIRIGIASDARKRLQLEPTVCVLITRIDVDGIEQSMSTVSRIQVDSELDCKWLVYHLGYVFSDDNGVDRGFDHIDSLRRLLVSIDDESSRIELIELLTTLTLIRIADELHIGKIVCSTSADRLSRHILNTIACGRGDTLSDVSAIVDKRHSRIQLLRPMKDISEKELAIVNRFEHWDQLTTIIDNPTLSTLSIQSITDAFVDDLQPHFPATISTVLSTACKVAHRIKSDIDTNRCRLCFSVCGNEQFCNCCKLLLNDRIVDRSLLPLMLR